MKAQASPVVTAGWTIKRTVVRLGWPGFVGLSLLVLSVVVQLFAIQPSYSRVKSLGAEARQLSAGVDKHGGGDARPTQGSQLSNFYAFFPLLDALPIVLNDIQLAAQRNGLNLEKGEYRLLRDAQFPLVRYQISLPVSGNYTQIRNFVNDVLDHVPSAALEDFNLKRDAVGVAQLDARVRFIVFLSAR
ncbi:MAG TPA: hypothetical protein VFA81_03525 [Burkholderiales bacterium]|nr:hypothetical protein [Burkholderiales bacterium]